MPFWSAMSSMHCVTAAGDRPAQGAGGGRGSCGAHRPGAQGSVTADLLGHPARCAIARRATSHDNQRMSSAQCTSALSTSCVQLGRVGSLTSCWDVVRGTPGRPCSAGRVASGCRAAAEAVSARRWTGAPCGVSAQYVAEGRTQSEVLLQSGQSTVRSNRRWLLRATGAL